MNIGDWVSAVQNALAAVAIVAGAIWAYYKFLKNATTGRCEFLQLGAEHT